RDDDGLHLVVTAETIDDLLEAEQDIAGETILACRPIERDGDDAVVALDALLVRSHDSLHEASGERLAARTGAASPRYASRSRLSTRGAWLSARVERLARRDARNGRAPGSDDRGVRLGHALQLLERDGAVDHLQEAVLEQRAGAVTARTGTQLGIAGPVVDQRPQLLGDRDHLEDRGAADHARAIADLAPDRAIDHQGLVAAGHHLSLGIGGHRLLARRAQPADQALADHGGER